MARRDLLGTKPGKRRRTVSPPPKRRARWLGPVSPNKKTPKRKLPTAIGPGPDPQLFKLLDGATDLGEGGRRLSRAFPDMPEAQRLEKLREFVIALNARWLASPARLEREALARRNSAGAETDFVDDGDPPPRKSWNP